MPPRTGGIMGIVEMSKGKSINGHRLEIVERKGAGHLGHICDTVMEAISIALSRDYLDRSGKILHHTWHVGNTRSGEVPWGR